MKDRLIAVVRGGDASEREVSLRSGAAVLAALQRQNMNVVDWTIDKIADVIPLVASLQQPIMVFNMIHGRGGEDGQLQAVLDVLHVPYTGCGMLASAMTMDKIITKRIWRDMGLPTADYWVFTAENIGQIEQQTIVYPVMVKPAREGSSIGMCKVDSAQDLLLAVQNALSYDEHVLVERWIDGSEYTVAILGDRALPVIQLKTPNAFYDFEAKYKANNTQYLCPCGLAEVQEQALKNLSLRAFNALGARVWGRVDVMIDHQGQPWLLELNTVPGMTDHSLVPMAAKAAGLDFDALVLDILHRSLACAG
jgi:D-alanine-D-alanine ligase